MKKQAKKRKKNKKKTGKRCGEPDDEIDEGALLEDQESQYIEIDAGDAIVRAIDGVLVDSDEEEVRMLFYHYTVYSELVPDDIPRFKAIAEFRTSKTVFNTIVRILNKNAKRNTRAKDIGKKQKAANHCVSTGSVSMFG
jgi:hypothetical protein